MVRSGDSKALDKMTEASVLGHVTMPWPKIAVPVVVSSCDKAAFDAAVAVLPVGSVTPLDYDSYHVHIKTYVDSVLSCSAMPPLLASMIRMSMMAFMSSFVANPALGHLIRDLTSKLSANTKQLNFKPFFVRLPVALVEVFKQCSSACLPVVVHIVDPAVETPAEPTSLSLLPLVDDTPLSKSVRHAISALPFSSVLFAQ
jgi:hypothetical protein